MITIIERMQQAFCSFDTLGENEFRMCLLFFFYKNKLVIIIVIHRRFGLPVLSRHRLHGSRRL